MTERRAKEVLQVLYDNCYTSKCKFKGKCEENCGVALNTAITDMQEIQQYRSIGTVEECRKAVNKQKAKKPDYEGDGYADGQLVYDTWICPCCEERYEVDYDDYKHCPNCGQAIDWRNEE